MFPEVAHHSIIPAYTSSVEKYYNEKKEEKEGIV